MNIKMPKCIDKATKTVIKNRSTIATGAGIVGFVITTVNAVRVTPRAVRLKEIAEDRKGEALTPVETIKTCWKPYVIPTAEGLLSIGCILYGKKVDMNAIKCLGTAYVMSEKTCGLLEDKLKETLEQAYDMPEEAAIERVEEIKEEVCQPTPERPVGFPPLCSGEEYFWEPYLGTIFTSTEDKIEAACGYVNKKIMRHDYSTLFDFYWHLGIESDGAYVLEERGWNEFTGPLEVSYGAKLIRGIPVKAVRYKVRPTSV